MTGKYVNLETTDRGQPASEAFYRNKSTITDSAIKNGVYLQSLNKKESVATMVVLLNELYEKQGKWQQSIDLAKLLLRYYPKYAYAMIKIGNGYSGLLDEKVSIAQANGSYSIEEKKQMDDLYQQNIHWFEKAEKLGWQMPTQEENENYLNSVRKRQKLLTRTSQGK